MSYIRGLVWYESRAFSPDYTTSFPLQSGFKNQEPFSFATPLSHPINFGTE